MDIMWTPTRLKNITHWFKTCTSLDFVNMLLCVLWQEMLALGCSNFLGSFFKIHVICCALSVTLAVDNAGGTSQVSTVVSLCGTLIAFEVKYCAICLGLLS